MISNVPPRLRGLSEILDAKENGEPTTQIENFLYAALLEGPIQDDFIIVRWLHDLIDGMLQERVDEINSLKTELKTAKDTLRDRFAERAMAALIQSSATLAEEDEKSYVAALHRRHDWEEEGGYAREISFDAYVIADEMMAERAR